MNFGMIDYSHLPADYFTLPIGDSTVLNTAASKNKSVYIGLSGWGNKEWKKGLGAEKIKDNEVLAYYAKKFNSVELNATHYSPYDLICEKWATIASNPSFLFCPKLYKGVTHAGKLTGKTEILNKTIQGLHYFGNNLGPIFIQLHEKFSPSRKEELFTFLETLPRQQQFFLELRHPDWFQQPEINTELLQVLKANSVGLVITDTPQFRNLVHNQLTIPAVFIRFVCQADQPVDKERIIQWKQKLEEWYSKGLEKTYFFIHGHNESAVIDFAEYVQEQFYPLVK